MTKKEYLNIIADEISAHCVAEGFPSHGSNFELRFEEEKRRIDSMPDADFFAWMELQPDPILEKLPHSKPDEELTEAEVF